MPVYERGGSFQAVVNNKALPGGRLRATFATRIEGEAWELKACAALKEGKTPASIAALAEGLPPTLFDLAKKVETEHWSDMKGSSASIKNAYMVATMIGEGVCPADVNDSTIETLVAKLKARGNTNATINRKMAALSKMLSVYHKKAGTKRPDLPRLKEAKHRIRYITEDEEERVLRFCRDMGDQDFTDFVVVGMDTGLRTRSEHLALEPSNVLRKGGAPNAIIVHPDQSKTDTPRVVPLTRRAQEVIARRGNGLFSDFTYAKLLGMWGRMAEAMGLDEDEQFVPYVLRHTFCSRLVQRGVHLVTVKELAGHSDIKMTMRYAHLAPHNYTDAIKALETHEPTSTSAGSPGQSHGTGTLLD